ncbi:glycoside hydrolase domain-containing protein [Mesorhizobium carmichaelinearum]|uniref:glycoside hydrolase domain-containing protein n=1 Tax=Mesorhizobium carmichaelinearum TaxID=1208188 RepID=UPI000BA360C0|nr:glycoside hydrolase domain-containing protein [Mesorhizobium carmichaelinearum]
MPSQLQQTIIVTLDDIEKRLDANPSDPEKTQLLANANVLVALLGQVDDLELRNAADSVTAAAAGLQQVIDAAGNVPLNLDQLTIAGSNLRKAIAQALGTAAPAVPAPAAPVASGQAPPAVAAPPPLAAGLVHGLDCATDCTAQSRAIAAAGKAFVVRYYRNGASGFPTLTAKEAKALTAAGVKIVTIWESASANVSHFSRTTGLDEGTSAYKQAMLVGQPAGTPIYFAVDFDCSKDALAGSINDYFQAIASAFAAMGNGKSAYSVGVYGSGRACTWLTAHGLVAYTWLAMSKGWSGYAAYTSWNIKQGPSDQLLPFDYDTDVATGDYGGFNI